MTRTVSGTIAGTLAGPVAGTLAGASSPYLFTVCLAGAEAMLKRDIANLHPGLRLAYSRPGLVTFKSTGAVAADAARPSVFARAWGASLGRAADAAAVVAAARGLGAGPLRLHVLERELYRPDQQPPGFHAGAAAARVRAAILAAAGPDAAALFHAGEDACAGDAVLDVVIAPDPIAGAPAAAEEPWLIGCHVHGPPRSPHPGGRISVKLPAEAPSRAYLKLEEALAWSSAPLAAGDVALELGSAPGGVSYALVRRGIEVWGVDPGDMDPAVLAYRHGNGAAVRHLKMAMGALRREQLPPRVDWLLMDVNIAPQVALHSVRRLVPPIRRHLCGVVFTLKLNELRFVDQIAAFVERIRQLGMAEVAATQLPSNRQEICVVGLTALGLRRQPAGDGFMRASAP